MSRRRDRRLRRRRRSVRSTEITETQMVLDGHAAGGGDGGHRPPRHRLHRARAAATTSPAGRSRSCRRSTPSARGRRSPSRTSRWTAPGRCTRRGCGCSTATSTSRSCTASGGRRRASLREICPLQLDPYYLAPLGLDPWSLAALQARALLDAGQGHRARLRRDRRPQPAPTRSATRTRRCSGDVRRRRRCSPSRYVRAPLRAPRPARRSPTARPRSCSPPATWRASLVDAAGVDPRHRPPHRVAPARACATSPCRRRPRWPRQGAGVGGGPVEVAELHAPFTPQELILREALGLGDDVDGQPVGRRARRQPGDGRPGSSASARPPARSPSRAATACVAHATGGQCLQQNLVCVLEGSRA